MLDLDNGYLPSYLGGAPYARLVTGRLSQGDDESRLIAMRNLSTKPPYEENQNCSATQYNIYTGFTFSYLSKFRDELLSMVSFFNSYKGTFNNNNWQDIALIR